MVRRSGTCSRLDLAHMTTCMACTYAHTASHTPPAAILHARQAINPEASGSQLLAALWLGAVGQEEAAGPNLQPAQCQ